MMVSQQTHALMWWHLLHIDRPAVLLLHPLALQSWWDGCSDTVLMWHYPQYCWWHWLLSHLSPSFHIQHCTRKMTSNIEFLHIYYNLRVREFPVSTCQIVYATDLQNAVNIQLVKQIKSLLSNSSIYQLQHTEGNSKCMEMGVCSRTSEVTTLLARRLPTWDEITTEAGLSVL